MDIRILSQTIWTTGLSVKQNMDIQIVSQTEHGHSDTSDALTSYPPLTSFTVSLTIKADVLDVLLKGGTHMKEGTILIY